MQPRLRRGSGSNDQAMQVFIKNPCRKNRRNIIGFFKPAMKKQEYIRHYFLDEALERREADSLRNI
jgi:hypothetical protein